MNEFQKKLLEVYGGGEYAHLNDLDNPDHAGLRKRVAMLGMENYIDEHAGDTLLLFLFRELEGAENKDDARRLMLTAIADMTTVVHAITDME